MNRTLKKVLACVMTVIMLVSAAPLGVLAEIDLSAILPDLSVKSQAVNTTYNAVAAAEYAKRYAINYNKEWWFYSSGGDCANFVSQALFAGGMPMTSTWHCYDSNIHNCRMTAACDYTWIRAQQLCDYLISIGGQAITNPSASDFSIGDAVFYDWNGGGLDHSAVVTDIVNGQPKVSAHSTPESASRLNAHWTYNRSSKKIVLVKLYGKTCEENNSPSYDFYHMNQSTGVYAGPGYGYTQLGTITYYDMVRVTRTTSTGGRTWGYFNFRGSWGWVDLTKASYWGHFDRIQVNHIFGSWFTVKQATCIEDGLERHVCSRCGFTEDRILAKGGHVEKSPATCTAAAVCKACGITLTPALGHDFTQWVSVKDENFTVYGKFEKIDSDNISDIEPEKTAEYKDGIATITLSAFAKTKIVEFASTKTTPVDVVMVLDQSGSMKETIGITENGKNITRQEKLILVFEADHFSYYVICPVDPATGELLDDPSYADAYCAFHGHSYEDAVTKPTFKEDGYTTHTCTVCGDTYVDTVVPANCDCICHRDNVFSRIVRWLYTFMNKLFKANFRCCDDMEPYSGGISDLT